MLRLYVDEIPDELEGNLVHDVEEHFDKLELKCSPEEKKMISLIEKGKLLDEIAFEDRFGYKLYTTELSTGCKAALCVLNSPDRVIDLIECGLNARDAIITLCENGSVIMDSNTITISNQFLKDSDSLEVRVDNYVFTSLDRLNHYLFNERPFKPDMLMEGIEEVTL